MGSFFLSTSQENIDSNSFELETGYVAVRRHVETTAAMFGFLRLNRPANFLNQFQENLDNESLLKCHQKYMDQQLLIR